jgi:hypothetical protein
VHLLCHLDSPSAASLPYLGLQEQTGPEFSGLYGSYRVPSRSSLLPLRTLSPGGVAHRPTSLMQSSTAWSQQSTENTDNCFSKRFSCHRIISRDDFGAGFTHRLAQFSPNNQGFFHSSSTQGILVQEMRSRDFLEQTQTHSSGQGIHGFPRTTQAFRLFRDKPGYSGRWRTSSTLRGSGQNGGEIPPTVQFRAYICMH